MKRTHIVLHHSVTPTHHKNVKQYDIKDIRDIHLKKGYSDVGYNFVIPWDGTLQVGRPLTIPGAHAKTGNMNNVGIGICLIGDFTKYRPSPAQYATLIKLCRDTLMPTHKIPVEKVIGHGKPFGGFSNTECPGKLFDLDYVRGELKPKPKAYVTKYPLPGGILRVENMLTQDNADVVKVQKAHNVLERNKSKHLKEDGLYGPKTKGAVASLQKFLKVKDDGIYGPKTRTAMEAELKRRGL